MRPLSNMMTLLKRLKVCGDGEWMVAHTVMLLDVLVSAVTHSMTCASERQLWLGACRANLHFGINNHAALTPGLPHSMSNEDLTMTPEWLTQDMLPAVLLEACWQ